MNLFDIETIDILSKNPRATKVDHPWFDFAIPSYNECFVRETIYYSRKLGASLKVLHYSDFRKSGDMYIWSCCTSTTNDIHQHETNQSLSAKKTN